MSNSQEKPFWQSKTLEQMDKREWESLCDGCARCCLQKLEDEDTDEVFYTSIVCRYLDESECRCSQYEQRHELVPNCVWLSVEQVSEFHWLPDTCAYRLIAEGRDLPWWHPLVSGKRETVHEAGISIKGRVLSEAYIHEDDWQEHIIRWVE